MIVNLVKHAPTCGGSCRPWLASGAPTCIPDPCWCWRTKLHAPEWGRERCWWRDRTTHQIKSRCPCWGGSRDGKPGACCSHHSANPRYITALAALEALTAEPGQHDTAAADPADPEQRDDRAADADGLFDDWDDMPPSPYEVVRRPLVRHWPPEDLLCSCDLSFLPKTGTAVHCSDCCETWANPSTHGLHRRRWTEPCRAPEDLRDVDTGRLLVYQDVHGIWRDRYPTAA